MDIVNQSKSITTDKFTGNNNEQDIFKYTISSIK